MILLVRLYFTDFIGLKVSCSKYTGKPDLMKSLQKILMGDPEYITVFGTSSQASVCFSLTRICVENHEKSKKRRWTREDVVFWCR